MQSVSERPVERLPDDVWQVILDDLPESISVDKANEYRYDLEKEANIMVFEGGAFIGSGKMFDLYVVPEKRGKWPIRSKVNEFIDRMFETTDEIILAVYSHNTPCLRLTRFFGFKETHREQDEKGELIWFKRLRND